MPDFEKKIGKKAVVDLPEIESLGKVVIPVAEADFCCGCVCVSKCFGNSPAAMMEIREMLKSGNIKLSPDLKTLIETSKDE